MSLVLSQEANENMSIDELHALSKRFFVDQFKPFEEKGITEEMILSVKDEYFSYQFTQSMNQMQLQLWTIIDG